MTHFEVSFPVRYYETDQMAVVHHSNYIRYFEIARNSMMVAWGFPIERCENEYLPSVKTPSMSKAKALIMICFLPGGRRN